VALPEVAVIVVVPFAIRVATPEVLMLATLLFDEFHVGVITVPELFVAKKLTVPEVNDAVNASAPVEVHPVQEMVSPPVELPTLRVVVPLMLP